MTATTRSSSPKPDDPRRPSPTPPAETVELELDPAEESETGGLGRRGFLGWAIAAPTLMVGTQIVGGLVHPQDAQAVVKSPPELADVYDLGDLQDDAALPTSNLITVTVNADGTATFALPRAEVGQGVTTSSAMLIAEDLDLPVERVNVTLADARPELLYNQLTGGSNTTRSTYTAIRLAAGLARLRLMQAAAKRWNVDLSTIRTSSGVVRSASGRSATYGSLAKEAASSTSTVLNVRLKPSSAFKVIGTPHGRVDAKAIVRGRKQYTMDINFPNAWPTMVCRAPTIKGTPKSVSNAAAVQSMPGITDVVMVSTGVAVRGRTFGQCIDAVRALKVVWNPGTEDGKSDADVLAELKAAELPLAVPKIPLLAKTVEGSYTFYFNSNSPLETNCAIADVKTDDAGTATSATIWSSLKVPILLQQDAATLLGLTQNKVTVHVTQGGGSFGRHLFSDAALEAAEISHKMRKPVKLMWARTDDFRQGRTHPMATSRVRATYLKPNVLTYEQRHTSVSTDFTHGLGEILTAMASRLPGGHLPGPGGNDSFAQSIWELTQTVSYDYGATDQVLNEVDKGFPTGSMRNIYSPDARTAQELVTDKLVKLHRSDGDRYLFRREFLKDPRGVAVLDAVAKAGNWGRTMPPLTAQGIAVHNEYKGWCAALVELDCRPGAVNRKIEDAYTGPRVLKVVFAVDVGLVINPTGLEAQMQGGIMDGIAKALTSSLHLRNGYFAEGSWDNYWYTRQWNAPPSIKVIILPSTSDSPGGAGEFGVAATMAAVASAYGVATGKEPTEFPINHRKSLTFTVLPTTPPIPQSPTDGLIHDIS